MIIPNEFGLLTRRHHVSVERGWQPRNPAVTRAAFVPAADCSTVMPDRSRPVPPQRANWSGPELTAATAALTMELAPAYPAEAGLRSWRRTLRLDRGIYLLAVGFKTVRPHHRHPRLRAFGPARVSPNTHKARRPWHRAAPLGVRGTRW
jgi:hypothetical protein